MMMSKFCRLCRDQGSHVSYLSLVYRCSSSVQSTVSQVRAVNESMFCKVTVVLRLLLFISPVPASASPDDGASGFSYFP